MRPSRSTNRSWAPLRLMAHLLLVVTVVAAVAACDTDPSPVAPEGDLDGERLRVGLAAPSIDLMNPIIADELGFFEEEGLEVEIFQFGGGQEGSLALLGGDVDVLSDGLQSPVLAEEIGEDMVAFYGSSTSQFSLWGGADVETLDDLRDRLIATNPLGSPPHLATILMLQTVTDLDPDVTVELHTVSGPGARLAALEAGQTDAAILALTESYIAEDTYHLLATMDDIEAGVPNTYNAMRSFIDENEAVVAAFTRAIERAAQAWSDDPDAVVPIIVDVMGLEEDITRRVVADTTFPQDGQITDAEAEVTVRLMLAVGEIANEVQRDAFVDDRFIGG